MKKILLGFAEGILSYRSFFYIATYMIEKSDQYLFLSKPSNSAWSVLCRIESTKQKKVRLGN